MPRAEEDLAYWKAIGDKRIMKRITKLLADILEHHELIRVYNRCVQLYEV